MTLDVQDHSVVIDIIVEDVRILTEEIRPR